MPEMTKRQAADWPRAIAEAQRHVDSSTIQADIDHHEWCVRWHEESRPGRGHLLQAMWSDGEHVVSIFMDVYGNPSVAVAQAEWIHNSSDDECSCGCLDDDPASPDSGEVDRG